jgi:hypothetical protein
MPIPEPDIVNTIDPDAGILVTDVDETVGPMYERELERLTAVCNSDTVTRGNLATDPHVLIIT